jgi:hypothetical protein
MAIVACKLGVQFLRIHFINLYRKRLMHIILDIQGAAEKPDGFQNEITQ